MKGGRDLQDANWPRDQSKVGYSDGKEPQKGEMVLGSTLLSWTGARTGVLRASELDKIYLAAGTRRKRGEGTGQENKAGGCQVLDSINVSLTVVDGIV